METLGKGEASTLLLLLTHDMRNPAATVRANLGYVQRAVEKQGMADAVEAIADSSLAINEIARALDNLDTIARWLAGEAPTTSAAGELSTALKSLTTRMPTSALSVEVHDETARVPSVARFTRLVELLVENAETHAPGKPIAVRSYASDGRLTVEVQDKGRALATDLRSVAFTAEGQHLIKTRVDGRYSRCLGLLAAKLHADAIGGELEADGQDGSAIFRIKVAPA